MDGWAGLAVVTANVGLHAGRWTPRTTFFHTHKSKFEVDSSMAQATLTYLRSFALASTGSKPSAIQNQYPFSRFGWKKGFLCSLKYKSYFSLFFPPELA